MTESKPEQSRGRFDAGYYCAESVLMTVAEQLGIESDLIPRIATGFCSGVADTRGMCGAVSGAIMGIGLAKGRQSPDIPVDPTYAVVQQFLTRFNGLFGSSNCYELCGCDLGTPEGQAQFRATNQHERCGHYVAEATRITLELIDTPARS
jgi:C_GCAxxG_C_C family probable redox protein